MAININGQVLRNVPEQVSKNVEDIEELQDRVTDLENGIIGGDLNVGGDLAVTGSTALAGALSGSSATYTGAIAAASETLSGNLAVGGTITASGDVSAPNTNKAIDIIKGNQTPASYFKEGSITLNTASDFAAANGTMPYGHWRISNGKLNIVVTLDLPANNTLSANASRRALSNGFNIPASVAALLFDIPGATGYKALDTKTMVGTNAGNQYSGRVEIWILIDSSGGARIDFANETITNAYVNLYQRFEFNFIL